METKTSNETPSPPANWPPYVPSGRRFLAHSLLKGTEPMIWRALGTMAPQIEAIPKQMAIRQALCAIGFGWVATNTILARMGMDWLYYKALVQTRKLNLNLATVGTETTSQEEEEDYDDDEEEELFPNKRTKYNESALRAVEISTLTIPANPILQGQWIIEGVRHRVPSNQQRVAIWHDLVKYGACVIRNAVDPKDLQALTRPTEYPNDAAKSTVTYISENMGNGVAGTPQSRYMEVPISHSACLLELESALWDLLTGDMGDGGVVHNFGQQRHVRPKMKNILLQYGEGAEHWARQDNHPDALKVHAVLMLSEPEDDFVGGQFFVAQRNNPFEVDYDDVLRIHRHFVEWENAGDLVIFWASTTAWFHGTMPVKKGTKDPAKPGFVCQAVGMLQPL